MRPILRLGASLLSLRALLLLATILLLLAPLSISWLEAPNRWLFRAGVQLSPKPDPVNRLVKVTLSQREVDRLVNDIPGAMAVGDLLQGLQGVYTLAVVVLLDDFPRPENYAAEVLVKGLLEQDSLRNALADSGVLAELQALAARQQLFQSAVDDGAVLLGIAQGESATQKVHFLRENQRIKPGSAGGPSSVLQAVLERDRGVFHADILPLASFRFESGLPGFAFYRGDSIAYPLLWRVNDAIFPDLVTESLRKARGATNLAYQSGVLGFDNKTLPLSAGAVIYPFYSTASGKAAPIETIALADLQKSRDYSRFHNKLVLVGVKDSPQLENVASALYSLDKQAYYVTPAWYGLAEKGGLVLLLLYMWFLLPRLSAKMAAAVTAVLVLGLLVLQLVLQVAEKHWFPVAVLMAYLVLGHLILWLSQALKKYAGEWQVVVIEKGAPLPSPKNLPRVRNEPRLPSSREAGAGLLGQMLDRTMAITRPGGKLKLGRYEVDREVGRGAMGVVYLGHDPLIDRQVAIKTLNYAQFSPEELQDVKARFFREAKAVGKFNHDNIVTIYDTGEEAERAYIAMEYVEGKPLSTHVQKNTLITHYDTLYWIIESVADALHYAHEKGVIHRDIKPGNILYDEKHGKVKVSDFGIARIINSSATRTGEIMGSPLYMSPEQVKGEKLTGQTDIYSLGVSFYQLLTGELPFRGDTIPAITHQIVQGKYTPVTELNPKVPASAQKIIAKAMHKDPERRYASAHDMMEDIMKYREKEF